MKVPLHDLLLAERRDLAARRLVPAGKRLGLRLLAWVLASRWRYELGGRLARAALRLLPRPLLYVRWNVWGRRRELPAPPAESFRDAWRRTRGAGHGR